MKQKNKQLIYIGMALGIIVFLLGAIYWRYRKYQLENQVTITSMPANKKVVIIDAGHGGWDPGVIVQHQGEKINEADINLEIALRLQEFFMLGGATTIMTRVEDAALGDTKKEDLAARVAMASDEHADIFISIHQNRFEMANVKGAQVFFYTDSPPGEALATTIQNRFTTSLDPDNKRPATGNRNYYILEKTSCPAVLIECGFLSNEKEKEKLLDETYQEKLAYTIYAGVVEYFAKTEGREMALGN